MTKSRVLGDGADTEGVVQVCRGGKRDAVLEVRINRPPANALGRKVRAGLIAAARQATDDDTISVVTLAGNAHCFSAGGDIDELAAVRAGEPTDALRAHDEYLTMYDAWNAIPVPVLVGVRRYAYGGALELALSGDLRFCTPEATFAAAGVRMGLVESAHSLPAIVGPGAAAEMLYTADPIDSRHAQQMGLVQEISKDLEGLLANTADRIAGHSAAALRATKEVMRLSQERAPGVAAERAKVLWRNLQRGDAHAASVAAFAARRAARR